MSDTKDLNLAEEFGFSSNALSWLEEQAPNPEDPGEVRAYMQKALEIGREHRTLYAALQLLILTGEASREKVMDALSLAKELA